MTPVKFDAIPGGFENAVRGHVDLHLEADLTGLVPHSALAGAAKWRYTSVRTGQQMYVLDRTVIYAADDWASEVWTFDEDFTAEQACDFLRARDAK
jgi:hypothetical protein